MQWFSTGTSSGELWVGLLICSLDYEILLPRSLSTFLLSISFNWWLEPLTLECGTIQYYYAAVALSLMDYHISGYFWYAFKAKNVWVQRSYKSLRAITQHSTNWELSDMRKQVHLACSPSTYKIDIMPVHLFPSGLMINFSSHNYARSAQLMTIYGYLSFSTAIRKPRDNVQIQLRLRHYIWRRL